MESKVVIMLLMAAYAVSVAAFVLAAVTMHGDAKTLAMYAVGTVLLMVSLIAAFLFLRNKPSCGSAERAEEDGWNKRG